MTYTPYPGDRVAKKSSLGFLVIRPDSSDAERLPIDCDVCGVLMRTSDDEAAWSKYKCCNDCSMKWAARRSEAWAAGWRPTEEEIKSDVASRPPIIVTVNADT